MSVKTEASEYYEAQLQKKVLYIPNLTVYLDKLHQQILKLPHEMPDKDYQDKVIGQTREDIINSFCNGVDLLYVILSPIRNQLPEGYKTWSKGRALDFDIALEKLEWCYELMEDMDILNDRNITIDMPEADGAYDDKDQTTDLPAPVGTGDDRAVGLLEEKDKEHLASKDLEKTV